MLEYYGTSSNSASRRNGKRISRCKKHWRRNTERCSTLRSEHKARVLYAISKGLYRSRDVPLHRGSLKRIRKEIQWIHYGACKQCGPAFVRPITWESLNDPKGWTMQDEAGDALEE